MDSIDKLTQELTAFQTLEEMCKAPGGYRPTILPRDDRHVILADAYDARQSRRGDQRRAYRGSNGAQPRRTAVLSVRLTSICPHGEPSRECCGYPEWLQVVHAINKVDATSIREPIACYDWWTGRLWAEEYPEYRILLGDQGNYVQALTPEAAEHLRTAVEQVTGRVVGDNGMTIRIVPRS